MAACADFDIKRKIKRQMGHWVQKERDWVQKKQNQKAGYDGE